MTATATVPTPRGASRVPGLAWVTWRQHRLGLAGALALLGGLALMLLVYGLAMHSAYDRYGLSACGSLRSSACLVPLALFENAYQGWVMYLPRFLEFLPGVLGVFLGAPLVAREFEAGTFRFAWTQGTHRVRWIAAKLALLGAVLSMLALAFSAVAGWWYAPWVPLQGRMASGQAYEILGIVFAARTLFAFMLGALLGALIRRVVPAMAATALVWLGVVVPSVLFLRPLIEAPVVAPEASNALADTSWVIKSWFQDAAGERVSASELLAQARASGLSTRADFDSWLAQHHFTSWVSFQPEGRFWRFQLIEASGYVLLALVLAAATVWWVRRRAT